jgi:hypothetical protein
MDQTQVIYWDRGRPARNEREARTALLKGFPKTTRLSARCGRDARGPSKSLECDVAYSSLWYNPTCKTASCGNRPASVFLSRKKPVHEYTVMLKRLSEAISQSNIESKQRRRKSHGSHHSSCNFNPNPMRNASEESSIARNARVNCVIGGPEPSRM